MTKRKSQPTRMGDIMDDPDGSIIEVPCDGVLPCPPDVAAGPQACPNVVAWPARSHEMVETMQRDGIPVHCDECVARMEAENEREVARSTRRHIIESTLSRSGIPTKWRSAQLSDLDFDPGREAAITAAGAWAEGTRRRGLLFHGPVGRGKTAIAAAAAVGRMNRGWLVRWLPVGELLMDLRMPFESPEYIRAQRALDPKGAALVLDDLDKVRPTEFAREPIYVAVNAWVEAELPLIVTMNRTLEDLEVDFGERYGPAVASRLAGYCDQIEVGGDDRRVA